MRLCVSLLVPSSGGKEEEEVPPQNSSCRSHSHSCRVSCVAGWRSVAFVLLAEAHLALAAALRHADVVHDEQVYVNVIGAHAADFLVGCKFKEVWCVPVVLHLKAGQAHRPSQAAFSSIWVGGDTVLFYFESVGSFKMQPPVRLRMGKAWMTT